MHFSSTTSISPIFVFSIAHFLNISATSNADILTGSNTANTLIGNAGNDTLQGLAGADKLDGGAGDEDCRKNLKDDKTFGLYSGL